MKQLFKQNVEVDFIANLLSTPDVEKQSITIPEVQPGHRPSTVPGPLVEPLTNRELDILELLAERLSNQEISDKLFISLETVKTHLKNIYQKLCAGSRRDAVDKARKLGILKHQ